MNGDPMSDRIYTLVCAANAAPGTPAPSKPTGSTGSGIIVDDAGHVLTNNHVVKNCKSITVKAIGSDALAATVNAVDPKNDLAILRTAYGEPIGTPARFRSQSKPARLGEETGVIGYPLTGFLSAEPKATFGQISSVAGYNNDYTLLQISAPVQPGNSGGPVLDASGLVIGVVVSQASLALASIVGNAPQNVNFAIIQIPLHFFNRLRIEFEAALASRPNTAHDSHSLQHSKMFGDRLPSQLRSCGQLRDRIGLTTRELSQQQQAGLIAERGEDGRARLPFGDRATMTFG
jgi:hypothetical protein